MTHAFSKALVYLHQTKYPGSIPVSNLAPMCPHTMGSVNSHTQRPPSHHCHRFTVHELSASVAHILQDHGAPTTFTPRFLGSILTTWHKVHMHCRVPILPMHPEYEIPRKPYGLTAHFLTHPEKLPTTWKSYGGDCVLWPSPHLLYQGSTTIKITVDIPHFRVSLPDLSPALYWYVPRNPGKWPNTSVGVLLVLLLDIAMSMRLCGVFEGVRLWELQYGYPKHRPHLTCIQKDTTRTFVTQKHIMLNVFRILFEALAIPNHLVYQDYRIPMRKLTENQWIVSWNV